MTLSLSNPINVQHFDLFKFGLDQSNTLNEMLPSKNNDVKFDNMPGLVQLPIINSITNYSIITIFRQWKNKMFFCDVNRDTGAFICGKDWKSFKNISLFDTQSFPNEMEVSLDNVSYWDSFNNYVKIKSKRRNR
tara:strand:- start:1234 stop:1635 length:402 start_codon:yes stop_codon:yes gene_type:complete